MRPRNEEPDPQKVTGTVGIRLKITYLRSLIHIKMYTDTDHISRMQHVSKSQPKAGNSSY